MTRILILALITITINGYSQILEPVKWTSTSKKISDIEYEIIFTAKIDNGWYIYSQNIKDRGPTPTLFTYENSDTYDVLGSTSEEKGEVFYDNVFRMQVKKLKGKTVFKQRIKKNISDKILVIGYIEYQSCSDKQCIQNSYDFEVNI